MKQVPVIPPIWWIEISLIVKPSNELDALKMSSAYIEEENNTLNKDEVDYKLHNIWYYPTSASSRTCKGVVLSGWVAGLMKLLEKQ